MTLDQFESFLESSKDYLEWAEDEDGFLFRDLRFDWYKNNPENATKVLKTKMKDLTAEELGKQITLGLKVEQIARVTGYFAKVNSFNAGKRGELKDRAREGKGWHW